MTDEHAVVCANTKLPEECSEEVCEKVISSCRKVKDVGNISVESKMVDDSTDVWRMGVEDGLVEDGLFENVDLGIANFEWEYLVTEENM